MLKNLFSLSIYSTKNLRSKTIKVIIAYHFQIFSYLGETYVCRNGIRKSYEGLPDVDFHFHEASEVSQEITEEAEHVA